MNITIPMVEYKVLHSRVFSRQSVVLSASLKWSVIFFFFFRTVHRWSERSRLAASRELVDSKAFLLQRALDRAIKAAVVITAV